MKRKTVARAMTLNDGTRDIWLIRLSVSPSPRYSASGSLLAFSKGSTARESIAPREAWNLSHPAAASASTRTPPRRKAGTPAPARRIHRIWPALFRRARAQTGCLAVSQVGVAADAEIASRAKAMSWVDWKRSSGRFSRQRLTIRSRAGGTPPVLSAISGGSSWRMDVIVSAAVSPWNARRRASISYSTQPKEKMSDRESARTPLTCSGDI